MKPMLKPMFKLGINPFASVSDIAAQLRSPIFVPPSSLAETALPVRLVPDTCADREGVYDSGESRATAGQVRSSGNGAGKETV